MPVATIEFHETIQDSRDFGSTEEHMVSRVYFSIEAAGKRFDDLSVDVKQRVGEDYETGRLEVARPLGYKGPQDHVAFRGEIEAYYRRCIGADTSGTRIPNGAKNVRRQNNRVKLEGGGSVGKPNPGRIGYRSP